MQKAKKIYFQYDFFLQFVIQLQIFSRHFFGKKNHLQEKFMGLSTENLLLVFFFIMLKFKLELEGSRFITLFPLFLELIIIIGKYVLRIGNLQTFLIVTTILNILYFLSQMLFYVYDQPKPEGKYKVGYTFFELPIKKQKVSLFYPVNPKTEPIRGQKYPPMFPQKKEVLNFSNIVTQFYLPNALRKIQSICNFLICQFFDYLLKIGIEHVFLNEKLFNTAPEQPESQQTQIKENTKAKEQEKEIPKKQKLTKPTTNEQQQPKITEEQSQYIPSYKIIILETGLGGCRNQHSLLSKELSSEGYLVFSIQPDDNLEQLFIDPCDNDLFEMVAVRQTSVSELIDFISFEEGKIQELLKVDFPFKFQKDNITIIGWQLGGASALYAAQKFSQVQAFIGLDPWLQFFKPAILKKGIQKKPALIISSQQFAKEEYSVKNFQVVNEYFRDNVTNLDQSFNCIFKQINHISFTDLHYIIPLESKYLKGLEINSTSLDSIFILNLFIKKYIINILSEKQKKQDFQQEFFLEYAKRFKNEKDLFNIIKFIEN